jgi:hypothetical protein
MIANASRTSAALITIHMVHLPRIRAVHVALMRPEAIAMARTRRTIHRIPFPDDDCRRPSSQATPSGKAATAGWSPRAAGQHRMFAEPWRLRQSDH